VIADGKVPPVRQQGLTVRAEDPADVGGVLERAVEVDVVGHLERQVHRDLGERHGLCVGRRSSELLAHLSPYRRTQRHERVQRRGGQLIAARHLLRLDDGVTQTYADPRLVAAH
jgi:hypothetical protein